jgi:DNA mismatch repair ATPase MutL
MFLIDVSRTQALLNCRHWQQAYAATQIKQRPLLIPQRLEINAQQARRYEQQQQLLMDLGFDITSMSPGQLLLRAIPIWLQGFDSQRLLFLLLDNDVHEQSVFEKIEQGLLTQQFDITSIDFKNFLNVLSQQRASLSACWREISASDLLVWLSERQAQHD